MPNYVQYAPWICLALFLAMVGLIEVGRRIGARRLARDSETARAGNAAVDGAVFALLGLLIAFTFSGAAGRFEARRHLIVEETNAIGTAWLRLDLLPTDVQPQARDLFRAYLDSRIAVYVALPDLAAAHAELARGAALQSDIWRLTIDACRQLPTPAPTTVLLPALNQMFDIATTRTLAARMHPPLIILAMLVMLALAASLLAGAAMAPSKFHSWLHIVVYAAIMAGTIYIILDLEFPRFGLIRVESFDQALVDLRQSMN